MRDAFGVQTNVRYSGIIEVNGLPTRPKLKNAAHIQPEDASATPTPDEHDPNRGSGPKLKNDQAFALAAASLPPSPVRPVGACRGLEAHHGRGQEGRAQHRPRRPGGSLDVRRGVEGAL
jgi:hypothetical protein